MSAEDHMEAAVPAKPGRSLVGFYIALGAVAALVGVGVLLYKPLRLCYAIHAVRSGGCTELPGIGPRPTNRWSEICLAAARDGNPRAMKALIDCSRPRPVLCGQIVNASFVGPSRLYLAAEARPEVFGAALDRLDDRRAREVIEHITHSCLACEVGDQSNETFCDETFDSLANQAGELARLSRLDTPGVARVAQATLDFARRRFARELTQAEDAEGLERRIAAAPYGGRSGDVSGSIGLMTERIVLAGKLAEAGPVAYPNLRRLLTSPDQNLRAEVLSAFHHPKYAWLLPLVVESARDGTADTIEEAYAAARSIVGGSPNPMQPAAPFDEKAPRQQRVEELRKALLAWWEREGQAKYGEPKK